MLWVIDSSLRNVTIRADVSLVYLPAPIAQVVERPLRDREVAGSILGRAISKA